MKGKILVLTAIAIAVLFFSSCKDTGSGNTLTFTLLQTSDLHSHAGGFGPSLDYTPLDTADNDGVLGGYSRIAALIEGIRGENDDEDNPVVVVDTGDFFMGTVFDLTAANPVSLNYFQFMDYDAVTLGNHEFDWSPAGLSMLLTNGINNGFTVPIIATNTVTSPASAADDGIEDLIAAGIIMTKKVLVLPNGLRIGLLGNMGLNADDVAPVAPPVTFNHDYAFLQQHVDDLRNNDAVDIVILLSHGGIFLDGSGDDADLAENVTGIDIIAAGHLHQATLSPFIKGSSGTIIFSPGKFGEWLSRLDVSYNRETGLIEDTDFSLIKVDDSIVGMALFETVVSGYKDAINGALAAFGYSLDMPVSRVSREMGASDAEESGLGNLWADAIRETANSLAPLNDGNPFQVCIIPNALIRDGLFPGKTGVVSFTDVYDSLPLGTSPDTTQPAPGYPLISIYFTGPDLRNAVEAGLTLSPILGPDYYLNFSGIRMDYDPAGAATLQGVTAIYLCPADDYLTTTLGPAIDLSDNQTLYHVALDLYSLNMMGAVTSAGLNIIPRDAAGTPIQYYMDHRVDTDSGPGVQELKLWMAGLLFLQDYFPASGDGIPVAVYGANGSSMGRVNVLK